MDVKQTDPVQSKSWSLLRSAYNMKPGRARNTLPLEMYPNKSIDLASNDLNLDIDQAEELAFESMSTSFALSLMSSWLSTTVVIDKCSNKCLDSLPEMLADSDNETITSGGES